MYSVYYYKVNNNFAEDRVAALLLPYCNSFIGEILRVNYSLILRVPIFSVM